MNNMKIQIVYENMNPSAQPLVLKIINLLTFYVFALQAK